MKTCPNCGYDLGGFDLVCLHCITIVKPVEIEEDDEPKKPCKHYSLSSAGRDPKVPSNVIHECASCGERFSIPQFTDPRRVLDGNRYTGD